MLLNITDFMIILKTLSTNTVNRLMVICYFFAFADVFVSFIVVSFIVVVGDVPPGMSGCCHSDF